MRRRDAPLCLWVFDILAQNGTDLREQTLSRRRQKLNKLMARSTSPLIRISEIFFDATGLLRACADRKMEGIVSKRVDMPYRSGPAKHWLKTKCPAWREANSRRHEFFQKQE